MFVPCNGKFRMHGKLVDVFYVVDCGSDTGRGSVKLLNAYTPSANGEKTEICVDVPRGLRPERMNTVTPFEILEHYEKHVYPRMATRNG